MADLKKVHDPYIIAEADLGDGRYIHVVPMTFGKARLNVGHQDHFYDDGWCYASPIAALMAAVAWDGEGEPDGWHRHVTSGRRRPDGDPAREYVNL